MSNRCFNGVATAALVLLTHSGNAVSAEAIQFSGSLDQNEQHCLTDVLQNGHWRHSPQFHEVMHRLAFVTQKHLGTNGRTDYVYIMQDSKFCGTAGCSMLIAEKGEDGACHEIYDGDGETYEFAVLRKRDHGYRRLYAPCELRFDGHQYQQIHDKCPSIDVQR